MLDLQPRYLEIVKDILKRFVNGQAVWAYGSRVKGLAHSGSDLDLIILDNSCKFKLDSLLNLRVAFSESNLPFLVDIFTWADLPESFDKQEIENNHEVIQY